jgi:hypothetical protein
MGVNVAQYPSNVWDGSSPSRDAPVADVDKHPDFEDWDQVVAEVEAIQSDVMNGLEDIVVPNGAGAAITVGVPVYMLANAAGATSADANGTAPARNVCGLLKVGRAATGGNVTIRQRGRLTLTTAEWDAVTGQTGGLTPFVEYYLSGTVAKITPTVPATTGDNVVVVGIAESTTVMNIQIRHSRISA